MESLHLINAVNAGVNTLSFRGRSISQNEKAKPFFFCETTGVETLSGQHGASRPWMIPFFCPPPLGPSHAPGSVCAGHPPAQIVPTNADPLSPSASSLLNPFLTNKISLSPRKLQQLLFYCQTGFHLLESIRSLFRLAVLNNSSGKRLSQRPAAAAQTDAKKGEKNNPVLAWKENGSVLVLPLELQS